MISSVYVFVARLQKVEAASRAAVLHYMRACLVDWPIAVQVLHLLCNKTLPGRVGTAFLSRGLFVLAREIVPSRFSDGEVFTKGPEVLSLFLAKAMTYVDTLDKSFVGHQPWTAVETFDEVDLTDMSANVGTVVASADAPAATHARLVMANPGRAVVAAWAVDSASDWSLALPRFVPPPIRFQWAQVQRLVRGVEVRELLGGPGLHVVKPLGLRNAGTPSLTRDARGKVCILVGRGKDVGRSINLLSPLKPDVFSVDAQELATAHNQLRGADAYVGAGGADGPGSAGEMGEAGEEQDDELDDRQVEEAIVVCLDISESMTSTWTQGGADVIEDTREDWEIEFLWSQAESEGGHREGDGDSADSDNSEEDSLSTGGSLYNSEDEESDEESDEEGDGANGRVAGGGCGDGLSVDELAAQRVAKKAAAHKREQEDLVRQLKNMPCYGELRELSEVHGAEEVLQELCIVAGKLLDPYDTALYQAIPRNVDLFVDLLESPDNANGNGDDDGNVGGGAAAFADAVDSDDVPRAFTCPITCALLGDPVLAADGHSYERAALMTWFESRHSSPMTGAPMNTTVRASCMLHVMNFRLKFY